jgi:enolase
MSRIASVFAWEALDSRGVPTVGCSVVAESGASGEVVVPSGASTGRHEAHELRDGGDRYGGRGVLLAVENVNGVLARAVVGRDVAGQDEIDTLLRELDGTADFSKLGANAVLAVSIASLRAAAADAGTPLYAWQAAEALELPLPMVNIVSGGAHAGGLVDIQDVLAVPVGAASFTQAMEWVARVRSGTLAAAGRRGHSGALVADEGGLAFPLASNRDAVEIVALGIEEAGLEPGRDVGVAVDLAASRLLGDDGYRLEGEARTVSSAELVDELADWVEAFPIVSLEDPLAEDDWDGWSLAGERLGHVQLLGDDLLVTNAERLRRAIGGGVANAVLVKPNQAGTVTDARRVLEQAKAAGYATVLSARSGDTEDDWLADLAVSWNARQIKVGSTMRSERTAKWNRLLRLEAELGLPFAGGAALTRPT